MLEDDHELQLPEVVLMLGGLGDTSTQQFPPSPLYPTLQMSFQTTTTKQKELQGQVHRSTDWEQLHLQIQHSTQTLKEPSIHTFVVKHTVP